MSHILKPCIRSTGSDSVRHSQDCQSWKNDRRLLMLWRRHSRFLSKLGLALRGFSWGKFGAVYCFYGALMCTLSPAPGCGDFLQRPGGGGLPCAGADTNGRPWFAPKFCSKKAPPAVPLGSCPWLDGARAAPSVDCEPRSGWQS